MSHAPDDMTLRDRVVASLRLNRELIEHLEQGVIPKVRILRRSTRPDRSGTSFVSPGDKTVHAMAANVLEADHFTVGVYQQLMAHCESICRTVQELTGERVSRPGPAVGVPEPMRNG